jgi:phospholipid-translocating ATPase
MGFLFLHRSNRSLKIKPYDYSSPQSWDIVMEFPFDSRRKRMTLIVKPPNLDIYIMMTKGADNEMLTRLGATNPEMVKTAGEHSNSFAKQGLRTLILAQRILTGEDVANINEQINRIKQTEGDLEDEMGGLYDRFETDLEFVGCIALEDKLQDEVPETIASLLQAGIKMWVLTGDKLVNLLSL